MLAEEQIWICLYLYEGNTQKNHRLTEVQIWILMNVYKGIRKKNDGLDPKYRFVFA